MLLGMRFWFEHYAEISLREQIVTQVRLGILCGELEAGERLPSIRELARRFSIHPNTVSAGYRELVEAGWVESRHGSGVFALAPRAPAGHGTDGTRDAMLDRLIAQLLRGTRRLGIPDEEAATRLAQFVLSPRPPAPRSILLIEPDPELRAIIHAELETLVTDGNARLPVRSCGFGECANHLPGALAVALPSKLAAVEAELRATTGRPALFRLAVRSVPESLAARLPARSHARDELLLGIASGWPAFSAFARTMLVAAGFDGESILLRDPRVPGWQNGLEETAAVICDLLTAPHVPAGKATVFHILHEDTGPRLKARLSAETETR